MSIRIVLTLALLTLYGGCQTTPPAFPVPLSTSQQESLNTAYLNVWQQSRASMGIASKRRIFGWLAEQDDSIRATLDDEQWLVYDAQAKDDWADKIYRSTRHVDTTETGTYGPTTTPRSTNVSSWPNS